ncbi:Bifunctional protein PaaZ [Rhodoplanes serenus]|jgi:acyl dehydratase|uniref:Bifunctional protein PaaZ n=1 Tax=Rhodoplanes serenus TaxID=200615 RepID=A0A447D094_9BRAD|nr:MaoC/PaaZ C-terminal domain-containing protein [Rhodoplanes serenus]MBI5113111.1 dehydratase [Rhodovulum sp.]VCU10885.1 Bifunctional protein PaaZ [Rhodoplanes serenus]
MIDQPFPELAVGQTRVSRGRTLTETDVVNFCMLTGNWLEIHANEEFAKRALFGRRVVQGSLVFSIVNALLPFDASVVAAFYGVDRLRFLAPSFIGDTVWARSEIIALREKTPEAGVVTCELVGANQRRERILRCEFSLLIRAERLLPPDNDPFSSLESPTS